MIHYRLMPVFCFLFSVFRFLFIFGSPVLFILPNHKNIWWTISQESRA
jgi:hypothetical protein